MMAAVEDFSKYDYDLRVRERAGVGLPGDGGSGGGEGGTWSAAADPGLAFERAILHLDLDSFFISVERLRDSSLVGRPLIVGGRAGRGVVASCSYEARHFGVRSGMPMRMALKLCPESLVIKGDMEAYSKYSHLVSEVIAEDAPLYEKSSIDEFYCDLTGMDKFVGCWRWSTELRQRVIEETGLPISFGLSVNKLVSKVGTGEAKPNGTLMIRRGTERDFLAPLPTGKLPGLGKETRHRLSFMGVRTVRLLREIPVRLLEREFGKHGRALSRKANGVDDAPVVPSSDRKSLSKERTFQQDTTDVAFLRDILADMVTRLGFDLRQRERLTACVTVKIRYTDFQTVTKQRRIPYTANDRQLLRHARELFAALHTRRQLVRLVGVRFSDLVRGHYQVDLFEDTERDIRLLGALDDIRERFGEHAIKMARCGGVAVRQESGFKYRDGAPGSAVAKTAAASAKTANDDPTLPRRAPTLPIDAEDRNPRGPSRAGDAATREGDGASRARGGNVLERRPAHQSAGRLPAPGPRYEGDAPARDAGTGSATAVRPPLERDDRRVSAHPINLAA